MRGRRTSLKRRLVALAASIAALVAGIPPATASLELNTLSKPGTTGLIRVRPVAPVGVPANGGVAYIRGDGSEKQDPNRTIGDVPVIAANQCTAVAAHVDCFRLLGSNGPFQTAWDGHTHYHPGEKKVLVNDRKFFLRGDTILIGSPYCNHAFLGHRCKRVVEGVLFDEQPVGEVNYVVGGVGVDIEGPGVIELAFTLLAHGTDVENNPIAFTEGTQVTKLPTVYPGQLLSIETKSTDLMGGFNFGQDNVGPNGAAGADGIADFKGIDVTADLIPPGCDPADDDCRRPLAGVVNPATFQAFHTFVPSSDTATTSWIVPQGISGVGTVGRSFDSNTPHTWYTVELSAHLVDQDGHVRDQVTSDGVVRWKNNSVAFDDLDCDRNGVTDETLCTSPYRRQQFTGRVDIRGRIVDNSNMAARDRRVENVLVKVVVTDPNGGRIIKRTNSCFDEDGNPNNSTDNCSFRFPTKPKVENHHGEFQVTVGSGQCINGPNTGGYFFPLVPNPFSIPQWCKDPISALLEETLIVGHAQETFTTGTYTVEATLENVSPTPTADTTFVIVIF